MKTQSSLRAMVNLPFSESTSSRFQKGGYGNITAAEVFEVSSNTGMVKIIHDNYGKNPKKFVNRLYNMGINKPFRFAHLGEGKPKIPHPDDKQVGSTRFALDGLWLWCLIDPLQTLTFYNAIANNGVMGKAKIIEKIESFGQSPIKLLVRSF